MKKKTREWIAAHLNIGMTTVIIDGRYVQEKAVDSEK